MKPLPVIAILLVLSACGSAPRGSGSVDGIPLGLRTELHLSEIQRSDRASDGWASYTAIAEIEDVGPTALQIGVAALDPGSLAVAVDPEGVLIRSRFWGTSEFDDDPEAAWENFWRQFEYRRTRRVFSQGAPDSVDAVVAGLYRHQRAMLDANFIIRRTMAITGRDETPPPDWYLANATRFEELPDLLEPLRTSVGPDALGQYRQRMQDAASEIRRLADMARAGDASALRNAVSDFRRQSCGSCHTIETGDPDRQLRDLAMSRYRDLGATRDLYRVGVDVWGVPGRDARSQEISDRIAAMMRAFGG